MARWFATFVMNCLVVSMPDYELITIVLLGIDFFCHQYRVSYIPLLVMLSLPGHTKNINLLNQRIPRHEKLMWVGM